jgi:hypothetical protein
MNFQGSSNRQIYDTCAYEKKLYESTSPLSYQLYFGAQENCNKCTDNRNFNVKYQPNIIDLESDLLNINRVSSKCDQFKYSPTCKKSGMCTSTFDKTNPVILDANVCPIVFSNIPRRTHPGYHLPNPNFCQGY